MVQFKISNTVDNSKVFLINFSDLKERYDPYFFKGEFHNLKKMLIKKGFVNIGQILKSWNRGDGPRDGYYTDDSENGVNFLRVNNLKNNSIDISDVKYIERKIHNTKLKRTQVTSGDLIFAISGTKDNLGTVSIIPNEIKEANLNSALVRLDIDKTKISNEFFCLLFELPFIRTQIEFTGKGAAQNNLNNNEIKSILIPNISLSEQIKLVNLYHFAYQQKQQKEARAKELLASIDTYLLNELGIALPEKDNSLQSRIFITNFSEVSGGRFDVFAILNKDFKIEGGIYPNKKLKLVANLVKGKSITSDKVIDGEYPVIAGGQSSPYNHNIYNQIGNVITVSASGAYSGYVWYHTIPIFASDCTVIQSKNELDISTIYLFEILKTKQQEIYHLQQGAGQPHVYARDLEKLNIPIPPPKKQIEIVNHIRDIRNQAKQLHEDAKAVLEDVKKEVEEMILG